MSATCDSVADRVTAYLGFSCHDANPIVTLRNPADLANATLPVLEILIIGGAIFAFVHALRRLRRDGDPTNLALWFASLVYLFVIEPPLYFPGWFGLDEQVGFIFAHNVFSVQFMYDRLPLYIVAIYPALSQLAYELVRSLGIFQRRGAFVGALCVAFVCQVFYEIFDQLGPQLKWWAWNLDNKVNHPLLAAVPMNSIVLFASVSFGAIVYLVVKLVGEPSWRGRQLRARSLVPRIVVAGALAPIAMPIASIPSALFGGSDPNTTAQAIVLAAEMVVLWVVGGTFLFRQWLELRDTKEPVTLDAFVRIYPAIYLIVFALLWVYALPDFVGAEGGMTSDGTPIGNAPYTLACFLAAGACVAAVLLLPRRGPAQQPPTRQVGASMR
ncbi:hypothetical protein [Antrihabitans sp. YC2-6]|uniref:hypothetical protein n=1 Tax=Antrihabitans sp. YC2-6 TaxID=2799498 RepID=UPI0018F64CD3|nr:hypothetical protein [Antrihabitans sp. YC2-6]MBJ8344954.1 hypothetical protein [Antrihabitans sp. YC2-6]